MDSPQLPVELWSEIVENVSDPSDLLTFRLVDRAWNEAASKQLKRIAYLSLDLNTHEDLKIKLVTKETKDSIKGVPSVSLTATALL
jgi:hypothetical protein